jgi:hypothetical protein
MLPNEKFLELAKKYEEAKDQMKAIREELDLVMKELGEGYNCQDHKTMLVYQIAKQKGTYVHFHELEFVRTKKESERAGSLSKKDAERLGYVVP